jgi:hypothetical protein
MKHSNCIQCAVAGLLFAFAVSVQAEQPAQLVRDAELLDAPAPKAGVVAKLRSRTPVSVLERKGGWYQVRGPAGEQGWVKLLALRLEADPNARREATGADSGEVLGAAASGASAGGSGSAAAGGAASGALGSMLTGQSTVSTAATGASTGTLSGERLVTDPEAAMSSSLEQIKSFQASDEELDAFAEEGGLGDAATETQP